MNEDEQIDLVALIWLGRGDGTIEDWDDLRARAVEARAEYRNPRRETCAICSASRCWAISSPTGLDEFGFDLGRRIAGVMHGEVASTARNRR